MYKQTLWLAQILPHFARYYHAADSRASSEWEFVRWQDVSPNEVRPELVSSVAEFTLNGCEVRNVFPTRTAAIRFGEKWASANRIGSEKIWLWKWSENEHTVYQAILPLNRHAERGGEPTLSPVGPTSTMVRISEHAHMRLKKSAAREGKSMQATLDAAIDEYDRRSFFAELDRKYAELQTDQAAWRAELDERRAWDATLLDGLEAEEWQETPEVELKSA